MERRLFQYVDHLTKRQGGQEYDTEVVHNKLYAVKQQEVWKRAMVKFHDAITRTALLTLVDEPGSLIAFNPGMGIYRINDAWLLNQSFGVIKMKLFDVAPYSYTHEAELIFEGTLSSNRLLAVYALLKETINPIHHIYYGDILFRANDQTYASLRNVLLAEKVVSVNPSQVSSALDKQLHSEVQSLVI